MENRLNTAARYPHSKRRHYETAIAIYLSTIQTLEDVKGRDSDPVKRAEYQQRILSLRGLLVSTRKEYVKSQQRFKQGGSP